MLWGELATAGLRRSHDACRLEKKAPQKHPVVDHVSPRSYQEKGAQAMDVRDGLAQDTGNRTPEEGRAHGDGYQNRAHTEGVAHKLAQGVHEASGRQRAPDNDQENGKGTA